MARGFNNIAYISLCILRFWCASLPGYVHPDEFFQSPEIMGGDVLGYEVFRPWEFVQSPQCRSIVIPYDLNFTKKLFNWVVWIVVKNHSQILLDYTAYTIAQLFYPNNALRSLLVFASSYVVLIFNTRPFSNSVESILLALAFCVYVKGSTPKFPLRQQHGDSSTDKDEFPVNLAFLFGCIVALGSFTRITFILYAFPIGLAFLHHIFLSARAQGKSWCVYSKFSELLPACLGLIMTTVICVLADSLYFGALNITFSGTLLDKDHIFELLRNPMKFVEIGWHGNLIITPLNNFAYNLDSNNLSQHGLHPRYLHIYNFVLLFGPLTLLTMKDLQFSVNFMRLLSKRTYKTVIVYSGLCGFMFLSLIPHQEARFLLPLLLPVIIVPSDRIHKLNMSFWTIWAVFNLVFVAIFGGLHQAGIVPIMQKLQNQALRFKKCEELSGYFQCELGKKFFIPVSDPTETLTTNIIFYKTYMPPRHLLGYPKAWRGTNVQVNVYDLAGSPLSDLENLITKQVPSKSSLTENLWREQIIFQQNKNSNNSRIFERTLLVTPSTTDFSPFFIGTYNELTSIGYDDNNGKKRMKLKLIEQHWPHVNFDHLDRIFAKGMYLNVYLLVSFSD
ncbi:9471_t:CDS:10 [Funneliformis mosseae]|uniref:Mannosyltransferase n=1 Tax=Funneliformis mosseae TaxID=27381 RepID=A0A9N8Z6K9_FUNMO|nr:9471_t:CDS:10 [Funneliformis mosseae]